MTRARYTRYTWPTLLFTRRDSRGSVLVQRSFGVVVIAVARAFCFGTRAAASFHTIRTISLGIAASSSLGAVGLAFFCVVVVVRMCSLCSPVETMQMQVVWRRRLAVSVVEPCCYV